jgi:DNA-directed RNA polymerase specialized sigma24 family protein
MSPQDGQRYLALLLPKIADFDHQAAPDLRTALVLYEYEDLSMAEIAAALDCSAKAVENRLYRARQQLKLTLQPIGETI